MTDDVLKIVPNVEELEEDFPVPIGIEISIIYSDDTFEHEGYYNSIESAQEALSYINLEK